MADIVTRNGRTWDHDELMSEAFKINDRACMFVQELRKAVEEVARADPSPAVEDWRSHQEEALSDWQAVMAGYEAADALTWLVLGKWFPE